MANLKDTIVLGNLTITGTVVASDILGKASSAATADNASYASFLKVQGGTTDGASSWTANSASSWSRTWSQRFFNSSLGSTDSGDINFFLRPNNGIELCVVIDGAFYQDTGKFRAVDTASTDLNSCGTIYHLVSCTASEYNSSTKNNNTLYFIK